MPWPPHDAEILFASRAVVTKKRAIVQPRLEQNFNFNQGCWGSEP